MQAVPTGTPPPTPIGTPPQLGLAPVPGSAPPTGIAPPTPLPLLPVLPIPFGSSSPRPMSETPPHAAMVPTLATNTHRSTLVVFMRLSSGWSSPLGTRVDHEKIRGRAAGER